MPALARPPRPGSWHGVQQVRDAKEEWGGGAPTPTTILSHDSPLPLLNDYLSAPPPPWLGSAMG